ncbi:MAG: M23 family metallopeptidase [Bacteroidaceae bacterium]|nr:M23 family metallopeptidase [Bacteroidaceae bacterium]
MRKVYYIYNSKTRTYDRIYPTRRQLFFSVVRRFFYGVGILSVVLGGIYLFLGTPSENALRIENSELGAHYELLSHRLDEALDVLEDLQQRDDNLYRVILQAEPISPHIRKSGQGDISRYEHLEEMANADMIIENMQKLDYLRRQLYIQSKSYDEIIALCKQNDERLQCIPAIQPVSNKDLKYTASGYGRRIDPIYKTAKFHYGMDFSANTGTPVYATGDGTITSSGWESGYGLTVEIDHGFGYQTRYAHLSKASVKRGQKVKRGETIGLVGSTGKSTGPHLHYEVVNKGQKVNPINYYFMDLTEDEYDQMIQMSSNQGKVYD